MKKLALLLVIFTLPAAASAAQNTKVRSAFVNKGEMDIQLNMDALEDSSTVIIDNATHFETEISYDFSDSFQLGFDLRGDDRQSQNGFSYETTGVEMTYQFSEQNENSPVAVALRANYDYGHNGADDVGGMLIFSHNGEKIDYGLNVGVNSEIGDGANDDLTGDIRASMAYVYSSMFKPGIEYYSDTGELDELNDFSDMESRAGPAIYGNITPHFSYEAAYLFGLSDTSPDGTYKVNLEYRMDLDDLRNPKGWE